ncbi:hypothetical protein SDC9_71682 [bioreactor metagenome]|uniref:Uncharacterized protein n=1 Tax=bioreactor metagenome TaxID=1076179 RepID=A0A644Y976_9ZZZZ
MAYAIMAENMMTRAVDVTVTYTEFKIQVTKSSLFARSSWYAASVGFLGMKEMLKSYNSFSVRMEYEPMTANGARTMKQRKSSTSVVRIR